MSTENYDLELSGELLDQYIISSKSCRIYHGCILESRFGRVTFDVSEITDIESCLLRAKNLSGNGKMLLSCSGESEPTNILVSSRVLQDIEIKLYGNTQFEFFRPKDGTGEVVILGLVLRLTTGGSDLPNKWKNIIAKCGKYTCLRAVGERLFASEGATIFNGNLISNLETSPANLFSRLNGTIKFLSSCEIISITLDQNQLSKFTPNDHVLYTHREAPTPILTLPVGPSTIGHRTVEYPTTTTMRLVESLISVYDSQLHRSFDRSKTVYLINKQVKLVNSNAKDYLLVKRGGVFVIPISDLQANSEYQIEATVQKLNGNGKIHFGFVSENNLHPTKTEICIAEAATQTARLKLITGSDSRFKLHISMHEDGLGEVLISRVIINKKSQQILPHIEAIKNSHVPATSYLEFSYAEIESAPSVRLETKHAALLEVQPTKLTQRYPELQGSIEATNFHSKLWLSRVLEFFPAVKAIKLNVGSWRTAAQPSVILSSLDTLKIAPRLWLEEYCQPILSQHRQTLEQVEEILTPSITNSLELRSLFPNKKISICPLPYPCISIVSDRSKQALYLERFPVHTQVLMKVWKTSYPKLFVLGSTLKLPDHVVSLSEYQSYDKLLSLISSSQVMIDLGNNINYQNGLLDLSYSLGTKIVTNNQYYLLRDNIKVTRSSISEHRRILDLDNLQNSIDTILAAQTLPPKLNNHHQHQAMATLLGTEIC